MRVGEAWQRGVVILAWDGVLRSVQNNHDGFNVAIHEFAPQLDMENGAADGYPSLGRSDLREAWPSVMTAEYQRIVQDIEQGRPTLLREYGAPKPLRVLCLAQRCSSSSTSKRAIPRSMTCSAILPAGPSRVDSLAMLDNHAIQRPREFGRGQRRHGQHAWPWDAVW